MLVNHKCSFSFYGCNAKMKLHETIFLEETCPDRTVTCPHGNCKEDVQMRKLDDHALKKGCATPVSPTFCQGFFYLILLQHTALVLEVVST